MKNGLTFLQTPFEDKDGTVYYLTEEAADELTTLLGGHSLDNVLLRIPFESDPKYPKSITSQELSNFLKKHAGEKLLVLSNSHVASTEVSF